MYNNDEKLESSKGFSLAEALITLLIISLVVILTTTSLARKTKTNKRPKGDHHWDCTVTSNEAGDVFYSVDSDVAGTGSAQGDHCEFIPPRNVKKFYVTAVGGGGGGASGKQAQDPVLMTEGVADFVPAKSDDYFVIMVGGGGGGGAKNCNAKKSSQGGGSGAVIAGNFTFNAGKSYKLEVGRGAIAIGESHSGQPGLPTKITGGSLGLVAGGGQGGQSRTRNFWGVCKWRETGYGLGGIATGGGVNGERAPGGDGRDGGATPGMVCKGGSCLMGIQNILGSKYAKNSLGSGGYGSGSGKSNDSSGYGGILLIVANSFYGGDGGKAGATSAYEFNKSPGIVKVVVGKGGKGSKVENMEGEPGGASLFGERIVAAGGAGGQRKYNAEIIETENGKIAVGGQGVPSAGVLKPESKIYAPGGYNGNDKADGDNAVAGSNGNGGGGGAGNIFEWGKGADGTPGIVRVTW